MRIAFMGSPDFAVPALRALHGAGHTISPRSIVSPRDPAGRGQATRRCSRAIVTADELGLPVRARPARLRTDLPAPRGLRAPSAWMPPSSPPTA